MFAAPTNTAAAPATRDFEKAKGFINVYVPTATGRVKIGMLPLKESNKGEKAVFDYLSAATDEADFESRLTNLVSKMQFEYNAAEGKAVELAL